MSTHNIHFHGEIRKKISVHFGSKTCLILLQYTMNMCHKKVHIGNYYIFTLNIRTPKLHLIPF